MDLILASRSPRRARLLREAGIEFEVVEPGFADPPERPIGESAEDAEGIVVRLATQKAASLADAFGPDTLILGADTLCIGPGGDLIGTPETRQRAEAMVRSFIGRTHRVITGVCLMPGTRGSGGVGTGAAAGVRAVETFADTARVTLGQLDEVILQTYLDSDAWRGKAGGYNLFDRRDAGWPLSVEGDETTVVGLPMKMLLPRWRRVAGG